jgi:predicted ester cyclase
VNADANPAVAVVRRFYEEAIHQKKLDAVDALVAPDFVHNGEKRGAAGQRQAVATLLQAFPDVQVTLDLVIADGDRVGANCIWTGTHQGAFMGVAPTGRRVSFTATVILRVEAGTIAQAWLNEDDLGLMQQLDAIPDK